MSLVPSLLQAIVKVDGEAMVMHAGDKPYVVSPGGQVELASRGLTLDAVNGIVGQLLPAEIQTALDEFGAIQYELPALPEFPSENFTVVAARGGDDVWVEIRRHRARDEDGVPEEIFPQQPPAESPVAAAPLPPVTPPPVVSAPPPAVVAPVAAVAIHVAPPSEPVVAREAAQIAAAESPSPMMQESAAQPVAAVTEPVHDSKPATPTLTAAAPAEEQDEEIDLDDDLSLPDETQLFGPPVTAFTDAELAESDEHEEHEIDLDADFDEEVEAPEPPLAPAVPPPMAREAAPVVSRDIPIPAAPAARVVEQVVAQAPPAVVETPPSAVVRGVEPATPPTPAVAPSEPPQPELITPPKPEPVAPPQPELTAPPKAEPIPPPQPELAAPPTREPVAPRPSEPIPTPRAESIASPPGAEPRVVPRVEPRDMRVEAPVAQKPEPHVDIARSEPAPQPRVVEPVAAAPEPRTVPAMAEPQSRLTPHVPEARVEPPPVDRPEPRAVASVVDTPAPRVVPAVAAPPQSRVVPPPSPIEALRPLSPMVERDEMVTPAVPQSAVVLPISRSPIRADQPPPVLADAAIPGLDRLLRLASARGAATLYLSSESRPSVRVDGELQLLDAEPVHTARDVESLLLTLMPERNHEALRSGAQTEWICDIDGVGRVRCMSFRDHRGPGGVFRLMPTRSVSVEQLGLPRQVQSLAIEPEGLVLIAGPRSSGKRTLMAAFVDLMNRTRRDHIITIEREINIVQEGGHSFISQREVRGDDDEMLAAARGALREDPDVLVIEDLRTGPLMNVALEAAASGRLVVGGFSAHTATGAIDRIIDLYAPEYRRQVQLALADSLRGVVVQVLLRKIGGGRLPAREVLLNTPAVASVIAEGKTSQLSMAIEGGRRNGMMPMNDALVGLVESGAVEAREAYRQSPDRPGFLAALTRHGLDTSFAERFA